MAVFDALLLALAVIAAISVVAWLVSLVRRDVSFVDSLWSLFFLAAVIVYAWSYDSINGFGLAVVGLVALWSLRLSAYITYRSHGQPEDRRYRAIRANHQPNFAFKSLFLVFLLQGLLAWIISVPLLFAVNVPPEAGVVHLVAVALWLVGFVFEAGGDWQLMRFKAREDSGNRVLDSGLWRYTRHPNYFGDACIWWAFWLLAAANGAWWTVHAPLLMTFLLLKVSGVAMLEGTIGERRPKYAEYVRRTSAFFPWPPATGDGSGVSA